MLHLSRQQYEGGAQAHLSPSNFVPGGGGRVRHPHLQLGPGIFWRGHNVDVSRGRGQVVCQQPQRV